MYILASVLHDEVARALGVRVEEVLLAQALGGAGGVADVVPSASAHLSFVFQQLCFQPLWVCEVECGKAYPLVLQVSLTAGAAHAGPYLESLLQSFLDDEAANEATGSRY
jgi:hypothetical protein